MTFYYKTGQLSPLQVPDAIVSSEVKLAQIFYVNGLFTPTKASILLKTVGDGYCDFFDISSTVIIDALNFSQIDQSDNKLIPYQQYTGYTSKGSLFVKGVSGGDGYSTVSYPIQSSSAGSHILWLKYIAPLGEFKANVYIDNVLISSIDETTAASNDWHWISTTFNVVDDDIHVLKIKMQESTTALDRMCIATDVVIPEDILKYQSSFITVHLQVYTVNDNDVPLSPLSIYDSKSTIKDIKGDDWYSFDLNFLDPSEAIDFDGSYALVVYASGGNAFRYLIWELVNNDDPYICGPSAIKI